MTLPSSGTDRGPTRAGGRILRRTAPARRRLRSSPAAGVPGPAVGLPGPAAGLPVPVAVLAGAVLAVTALAVVSDEPAPPRAAGAATAAPTGAAHPAGPASPNPAAPALVAPVPASPPPPDLPVIDYGPPPGGFPPDPAPLSTARLTEGLRPIGRIGAYDAPGGRPRAFLAPTVSGTPLVMPIVARQAGWAAVLLPSVNRTVAWTPPGPWRVVPLRDQIVVERRSNRLTWHRDGRPVRGWRVSLGLPSTPTPLGRTFVLGRSTLDGEVYAGTDVFALGAVPDDPHAVPDGLRGAHIGLHTWYHDGELGRNTTDGCIRLTRSGQRLLLAELAPGTPLVVVDRVSRPVPAGPDRQATGPRASPAPRPSASAGPAASRGGVPASG